MKYFYCLLLLILINLPAFSQDSTAKIIGPGVTLHSVHLSYPNNIKILEIDLKNPNIKIKTALANNVLGSGFETTTSMAKKNTYPNHIVLGAINADFFGISDPSNPYSTVINPMIKDKEFIKGVVTERSSFAINEDNRTSIGIMSFRGAVRAKTDSTFNITEFNGQRLDNRLILYNKYIGTNTRTNAYGTEVRLQLISPLVVNDTLVFVAKEVVSGVGSMPLNSDYVLSGHGTAQAFINNNIMVDDTIKVYLGTTPDIGNVVNFIGGGPKLINNGEIVRDLTVKAEVWTGGMLLANPRTAIGVSEDSTKIYFLVVDGRKPGVSEGMTFQQLAEYMHRIGCYNATNLDGGGSSTLVARGVIANSPSDASERSVGNSILAVFEGNMSAYVDSFYVFPTSFTIDSTQSKRLEPRAKDDFGYEIPISTRDVIWSVEGVNGSVDSNGIFTATNSGAGIIIAEYGGIKDTIRVTVDVDVFPTWVLSAATSNLPSWFSPTGSTERGMAYGNDELYVVNRPNILVLDITTGDVKTSLSTTGIAGGTFTVCDVDVSEDGIIVVANLTTAASTSPFKIYSYKDKSSDPKLLISFNGSTGRLGDKFTVSGSFKDKSAVIWAMVGSSGTAYKWVMDTDSTFNQTPTAVTFAGISNAGPCPVVINIPGTDHVIVNGNTIQPTEYNASGQVVGTASAVVVNSRSNAMQYINGLNRKYLIVFQYGAGNENASVLDVTNGLTNANRLFLTPSLGSNANTGATNGDVAYRYYKDSSYIIYVMSTNNGIGAYQLFDAPLLGAVDDLNNLPTEFLLNQNYPNPFNPSTSISYNIPEQSRINLYIVNALGEKIDVLENSVKQAGIYSHTWNAKNHASGMYLLVMEGNGLVSGASVKQVKKLMLVK